MTGSVHIKSGRLYIVLAYKDKNGKPHTKWVSTGLDAHNNRRRAAAMIPDMLQKYRGLEQLEVNSGTLFSDYAVSGWRRNDRPLRNRPLTVTATRSRSSLFRISGKSHFVR